MDGPADDGEGDLDPSQFLTIDVKTDEGNLGDDAEPLVTVENAEEDDGAISEQEEISGVQEEKGEEAGKEAAEDEEEPESGREGRKIPNGELHCEFFWQIRQNLNSWFLGLNPLLGMSSHNLQWSALNHYHC